MSDRPVRGLHIQFGGDAAREAVVSWITEAPVSGARVTVTPSGGDPVVVDARTRSYTDSRSGRALFAHHAPVVGLTPDTVHEVVAVHDGVDPVAGAWRTAPSGRSAVSFTTFGDQGVFMPAAEALDLGLPAPGGGLGAPEAAGTTAGVESLAPLFHLVNGDLAYSNLAGDRVETWLRWWDQTSTSARWRPWMTVPGNHENERGNGAIGYDAYRTLVSPPPVGGQEPATEGLWWAFTAGSVRIVGIHTDDLALQDAGDSYVHGYSGGAQLAWLRAELAAARTDPDIDWIVLVGHQVCMSTADRANGADLGLRRALVPLCDEFDVDLVLVGHEHHYERSHPIRGLADDDTATPLVASTELTHIDATAGTVHLLVGSGGTSAPTTPRLTTPPTCRVITAVGEFDTAVGRRLPVYVREDATWLASRNTEHPFGFAHVGVDPGDEPGGPTSLVVTYYDVLDEVGTLREFETFTLTRPRSDGPAVPVDRVRHEAGV